MKIRRAYLKSLIRSAFAIGSVLTLCVILANALYTPPYYSTGINCNKELHDNHCQFKCSLTPVSNYSDASKDLKLNLKVHFFLYNGMMDKTINATLNEEKSYSFQIPRRNYSYDLTALVYDDKGRGGAEVMSLNC